MAAPGPATVASSEARALAEFVESGKGLLIALDDRWDPRTCGSLIEAGLLPATIELRANLTPRRIASWDSAHPALAVFDAESGLDPRVFPWRGGFAVEPGADWQVLATLEGGQPLLLEKKRTAESGGQVMVLLHPLTRAWSDAPLEPMFVPFIKGLFGYLANYHPAPTGAGTRTPGIHEQRNIGVCDVADGPPQVVAPDAAESDVTAVDAADFRRAYGLPDLNAGETPPLPASARAGIEPAGNEWWPWLALVLLMLLCVEVAVATRRVSRKQSPSAS